MSTNKRMLLCSTDRFIQLVEADTGRRARRYDSETDIDGAAFWGGERIVLCLGGIRASQRTARILSVRDFTVISEFQFAALEVSSVGTAGDILLIHSLYRSIGIDLVQQTKLWEAFQRWETVSDGQIFFGACEREAGEPTKRIFGKCDLRSGKTTTLYAEELSVK